MRYLAALGLPPALELVVVLAVMAPRSITRRLHLDHLQVAASIVATTFSHVAITTIIQSIVAGPLRPSTS